MYHPLSLQFVARHILPTITNQLSVEHFTPSWSYISLRLPNMAAPNTSQITQLHLLQQQTILFHYFPKQVPSWDNLIFVLNAMKLFIFVSQPFQYFNDLINSWFRHNHRLETPLHCWILRYVLLVLMNNYCSSTWSLLLKELISNQCRELFPHHFLSLTLQHVREDEIKLKEKIEK